MTVELWQQKPASAPGLPVSANDLRIANPDTSDWKVCVQTARTHGRSFFLASRVLPPARRRAILAAYAFCRIADDIVDRSEDDGPHSTAARLRSWERQLEHPEHPVAIAFAAVRAEHGIPQTPVLELFEGLCADLTVARYDDWVSLRRYCYLVAGTVGRIVAPILGCRDHLALGHAEDLGIAMQLTNILRDVAEDARMGRVYLPIADLERFGITPEGILAGTPGDQFPQFMQFQIARARALYASAHAGLPSLAPSGRFATLLASELYSGILGEIEAMRYDVFAGRARVRARGKLRGVTSAALGFATASVPGFSPIPGSLRTGDGSLRRIGW